MLKNIYLEIEYIGTRYFGFQIQNKPNSDEPTVQGEITKALTRLFKNSPDIIYASRTDRGVHARGQTLNFKVDTAIPLQNIKLALNKSLPKDIRVKLIKKVPLNFHSRYEAKRKIYRYIILNKKEPDVFYRGLSWHINKPLSLEKMRKTARVLIGRRDFSLFAKNAGKYAAWSRRVFQISIKKRGSFLYIDISGDGFMRNMARRMISFLTAAGLDEIAIPRSLKSLPKKSLRYANKPAPAHGLYLWKISY